MYDCSHLIEKFHSSSVNLTNAERKSMKDRRDANLSRVKSGLFDNGKPSLVDSINQGSYAMQTMTQQPDGDETRYDIDLGLVFDEKDAAAPKTTRKWVVDAIAAKATNMKNDPEDKGKCVRVIYADGYQCDFPVFQRSGEEGNYSYEVGLNNDWTDSDPKAMNVWFEDRVKSLSPEDSGTYQLRRIVRLVKFFVKTWQASSGKQFPSGLLLTAIIVDSYVPIANRDDEALFKTLKAIGERSEYVAVFANGVTVSRDKDMPRMVRLQERSAKAADHLQELIDEEAETDDDRARAIWKKVFKHSYFDDAQVSKSQSASASLLRSVGGSSSAGRVAAEAAAVEKPTKPWST